jgi:hypothetical protein
MSSAKKNPSVLSNSIFLYPFYILIIYSTVEIKTPSVSCLIITLVARSIVEEMLDEAYLEYERGRDRTPLLIEAELEGLWRG